MQETSEDKLKQNNQNERQLDTKAYYIFIHVDEKKQCIPVNITKINVCIQLHDNNKCDEIVTACFFVFRHTLQSCAPSRPGEQWEHAFRQILLQ